VEPHPDHDVRRSDEPEELVDALRLDERRARADPGTSVEEIAVSMLSCLGTTITRWVSVREARRDEPGIEVAPLRRGPDRGDDGRFTHVARGWSGRNEGERGVAPFA